jgi:hypothetical protein
MVFIWHLRGEIKRGQKTIEYQLTFKLRFSFFSWSCKASLTTHSAGKSSYYQIESGRGSLELTEHMLNSFKFKIETLGANGHSCSISGVIEPGLGVAKVEDGSPAKPCEVKFSSTSNSVQISYDTGDESCRSYCGMRATFDGTFMRTDSECLPDAVRETGNKFKMAYDKKNYKEALSLLALLHKSCGKNLLW